MDDINLVILKLSHRYCDDVTRLYQHPLIKPTHRPSNNPNRLVPIIA